MGRDPLHTWPVDTAGVSQAVLQAPEANLNNPCTRFCCTTSRVHLSCPAWKVALPHTVQQSCWCRPWGAPAEPSHWKSHEAHWRKPQGSQCHAQNKAMSRGTFYPSGQSGSPQLLVPAKLLLSRTVRRQLWESLAQRTTTNFGSASILLDKPFHQGIQALVHGSS